MSDQLDTLIRSADPIPTAAEVPAAAWSAEQTWSAVHERIRDVDATVPVWRRPGLAVAAATLLFVVALGALLIVRDPDAEPTIESTVPVPTTIAPPTTTLPPTTTTTTTPPSTTAPPTTVSAEEAAWLDIPAWGTSNGAADTYRSSQFTPRLTFAVAEGWGRLPGASELPTAMAPMVPPGSSPEIFAGMAIYRHGPPALEGAESPSELVERITNHPSVELLGTDEVVVGGLPATRVEFDLTTGMTYLQPNQQFAFILPPGTRATSFVLAVDGETVSIVAFAPDQDQHTDLLELALPIVESIEWADI